MKRTADKKGITLLEAQLQSILQIEKNWIADVEGFFRFSRDLPQLFDNKGADLEAKG